MKLNRTQIIWGIVLLLIVAAAIILYFIGKSNGWFAVVESRETMKAYISSFNGWAPVVYFALQFMQVIVSPIPGNLTTLMGGLLFGFWQGFLISLLAVVLGSLCAFLLGKAFGRPLVERILGKTVVDKYFGTVSSRQLIVLILLFLLPVFPDDMLCLIAGITAMRFRTFALVMVLTRPWGLLVSALLGAGMISISIPLWVWIVCGAVCLALLFFAIKYAPQIEERVHGLINRFTHKKSGTS